MTALMVNSIKYLDMYVRMYIQVVILIDRMYVLKYVLTYKDNYSYHKADLMYKFLFMIPLYLQFIFT